MWYKALKPVLEGRRTKLCVPITKGDAAIKYINLDNNVIFMHMKYVKVVNGMVHSRAVHAKAWASPGAHLMQIRKHATLYSCYASICEAAGTVGGLLFCQKVSAEQAVPETEPHYCQLHLKPQLDFANLLHCLQKQELPISSASRHCSAANAFGPMCKAQFQCSHAASCTWTR